MITEVKDIKMNQLTAAIKELNELLFKPGDKNRVKTVGVSKAVAINGLKEMAVILNAEEGDKISQTTADLFGLLEIQIPEGVGIIGGATTPASPQTETKTKKEPVKAEKKEKEKAKPPQSSEFTRCQALLETLKEKKALSKEELAAQSNEVYKKHGGKDNLKEQKWAVNTYLQPLLGLDLVKIQDGGYLLV